MKKILYSHPGRSSFVRKDLALLEQHFEVKVFFFDPAKKYLAPWQLLRQFFFLLFNMRKSDLMITQFGGYHSYLPALLGKIFRKPSLVILGGSDCVSFPSINYGHFNKKLLGTVTRWSYQMTTHFSPVHVSLVKGPYTYTSDDYPEQGYQVFCPKVKGGFTELHYGYDHELFRAGEERLPKSFITVGYLNTPNYYRKGSDLIVALAQRKPDCQFTIVGGTLENIPVDEVPSNVKLVDSVSYEELTALYATHEFYMQLSICEGFPSSLCEAMLCGCVPIGSAVAAIPKIIGDTGYVLEKRSADDLERLVDKALDSDKNNLSALARKRIMDNYPVEEREKLVELCEKLIKKG